MLRNSFLILTCWLLCLLLYIPNLWADSLPGTTFDSDRLKRINEMNLNAQDPPRTKHIDANGKPKFTNRLALETSPYLLQHAHNPVNWYPWGDEAFETAKKLDRPILLSIGYSTCHWCHVMEEESFEDIEIATYLNENYIAIKVDREERPDIDAIYMKAVTALQGSGGWPMTVFLNTEKKPFYGGTYFPARDGDRGTNIGFLSLLERLQVVFHNDKDAVANASDHITKILKQGEKNVGGHTLPAKEIIDRSIESYKTGFDWENGGLVGQNKFPSSLPLGLLMRVYASKQDADLLKMITLTLDKMMNGGIHDHVAGGFHRYTTDNIWLTPHYEKMLYDNALLSIAYTEAYQLTGNEKYRIVSQKILDYLLKEMRSPEGGFYSATDADSLTPGGETDEGYFFTWTSSEIDTLFNEETSSIVKKYYGIANTKHRQILHIQDNNKVLDKFKINAEELENIVQQANKTLYNERLKRTSPLRDDKLILSWNSLFISALSKAGFTFNEDKYVNAAIETNDFIFKNLWHEGALYHSFKDEKRGHTGFLNDYTFFTAALIDLYEATFDVQWLLKAADIENLVHKKFEDTDLGGFFTTPLGQDDLIARDKSASDGALPSGNAIAVSNLIRLYTYLDKKYYRDRAEKTLKHFSKELTQNPSYMSGLLHAVKILNEPSKEVVIITPENKKDGANPFLEILRKRFESGQIIIVAEEGKGFDAISKTLHQVRDRKSINGLTTVYPCENKICKLPVTDPAQL
jgi:uncharacterized protein